MSSQHPKKVSTSAPLAFAVMCWTLPSTVPLTVCASVCWDIATAPVLTRGSAKNGSVTYSLPAIPASGIGCPAGLVVARRYAPPGG